MPEDKSLKVLADQKEKEWREVHQLRLESLEAAIREKDEELLTEQSKFAQLKKDFKYNFKLLNDRHAELETFDTIIADLRVKLSVRDQENSDLKVRIDSYETRSAQESRSREELQIHYQQRLKQKQAELEQYKCEKDAEVDHERNELETFKLQQQRRTLQLEDELEIQRSELSTGFDEALRKREHEFRLQTDEMNSQVLAYQLKVNLLSKELDLARTARTECSKQAETAESKQRDMEKLLKKSNWQVKDVTAMKDAKISELENAIQNYEKTISRMEADFKRKHNEMDQYTRQKQEALSKLKDSSHDREAELNQTVNELNSALEGEGVKIRKLEWALADLEKEKQEDINRLEEALNETKSRWDSHISQISEDNVMRDVELKTIHETNNNLKIEIQQRKDDISRYKSELNAALDREGVLERSKAQLELDWQRRYENVERQQFEKSEQYIQKLTDSKDQAQSAVKERERELSQRENVIQALKEDRDLARATLKQHGLEVDKDADKAFLLANDELSLAQQQNLNLRNVISQMRQQMELLQDQVENQKQTVTNGIDKDYVSSLEQEISQLKLKSRQLDREESIIKRDESVKESSAMPNHTPEQNKMSDNVIMKKHVESLNADISKLRTEKVELMAQVRKQQARLEHQQLSVDQQNKQTQDQTVEVQQLQYDLNAQARRHTVELGSLRQMNAELELQLVETRREADQFHKSNIEQAAAISTLSNQLSSVKMELAEKRPTVNYGAQELLIQQLQDELKFYRDGDNSTSDVPPATGGATLDNKRLQNKLRAAVKQIRQLAQEKQQLIQVGNRQRAELLNAGIEPKPAMHQAIIPTLPAPQPSTIHSATIPQDSNTTSAHLKQTMQEKLAQLEKLQYQLTKAELSNNPHTKSVYLQQPVEVDRSDSKSSTMQSEYNPYDNGHNTVDRDRGFHAKGNHPAQDIRTSNSSKTTTHNDEPTHHPDDWKQQTRHLLLSLSSAGGESLEDVWKLLDENTPRSPARHKTVPRSPARDKTATPRSPKGGFTHDLPVRDSQDSLILTGRKQTTHDKPSANRLTLSKKGQGIAAIKKKQKIRNYNIKDS